MGYNKFIAYGKRFELYQYEKGLPIRGSKGKSQADYGSSDFRDGGESLVVSGVAGGVQATKGKRSDNAQRASMAFRRLVACNLQGDENPLLLTFTYRENKVDVADAYRDFSSCVQALRYKFGKNFKYICVPEFQKRGAVHFHALFWGVQASLLGVQREWPSNSIDCYFWSYGFTFCKETDGHLKIASYLSKYMRKTFADPRLAARKAYVTSRNIERPVIGGGFSDFGLSLILDDYVGVDNSSIQNLKFDTKWLGSCDYQLFIIK